MVEYDSFTSAEFLAARERENRIHPGDMEDTDMDEEEEEDDDDDVNNNDSRANLTAAATGDAGGAKSHEDDSVSELDSSNVSNGAGGGNKKENKELEETIAKKESLAVFRLKLVVLAVLVLSMIGVGFAVNAYMRHQEESQFRARYEDAANKVFESLGTTLHLTLGAVDSLVVDMVSFARYANMTWPFVTVPDFAVRVAKIRTLSHAYYICQYLLVTGEQRADWEYYASTHDSWVDRSIAVQKNDPTFKGRIVEEYTKPYNISDNYGTTNSTGPYLPDWQAGPVVPVLPPYNWDGASFSPIQDALDELFNAQRTVIARVTNLPDPNDAAAVDETAFANDWSKNFISPDEDPTEPSSDIYYPILNTAADEVDIFNPVINAVPTSTTVGFMAISIYWRDLLKGILPAGTKGVVAVIGNECDQMFTYQINGPSLIYMGRGDLHDHKFDSKRRTATFLQLKELYASTSTSTYTGIPLTQTNCPYWINVYPSHTMEADFLSNNPVIFAVVSACIFLFTSVVFLIYDFLVEKRQHKVMTQALRTSAIVSSLFPSTVRDRLFNSTGGDAAKKDNKPMGFETPKHKLKSFLRNDTERSSNETRIPEEGALTPDPNDRPIADLFTDTTVLFADIAGFTAWSSVRQPSQVFVLLESLYGAFDKIATRRGVFKVETIGDSYVAVTGLPEPRADHAVQMAKFASDCRVAMARVTRELETTLGPETGDLAMRIGMNSGPVTAGVLRGQKTRFQLFGDTVNTASRMESTGIKNLIQISQSTADLLIEAGKGHWVKPRDELVEAKGKGKMRTYWVEPRTHASSLVDGGNNLNNNDASENNTESGVALSGKSMRLVDWHVSMMRRLIQQIIARRNSAINKKKNHHKNTTVDTTEPVEFPMPKSSSTGTVLDEVKEIIELPLFDFDAFHQQEDPERIELSPAVLEQLRSLIIAIAATYNNNPFHNFEHASHVTMSVVKLLSRIVAPEKDFMDEPNLNSASCEMSSAVIASSLHDHTYGITSDPLTQFACVFAALIHDADHQGVPNTVLVSENSELSQVYRGKSVAEQNSVDIALNIFVDPSFADVRAAICYTEPEARRFRQLVVNAVMATDIMDKDLKALRNARWDKAFHDSRPEGSLVSSQEDINRKATIVIEHLIQASDVAHTMQHWHIYRKWNERLFEEMYLAYRSGRTKVNPAEFWYQGEIGFFDFYIIPLAKKLSECGVFGVSSDECLNYAQKNREEWVARGEEVVATMSEKLSLLSMNPGRRGTAH